MKRAYIIYFFAFLTLCVTSCKKDFLDAKPTDRLAESSVWQSPQLIEAFLNNNYNDISDGFYSWKGHGDDNQMMVSLCDEAVSVYDGYEGRNVFVDGSLSPDNVDGSRMKRLNWKNLYFYVNSCNLFLKNMSTVSVLDDVTKKRYIAEMKTLRAFRYFALLRRWGGVPLVSDPYGLGADYTAVVRASIPETIAFIQKDLDDAIADLPSSPTTLGRVTKGVAMSLKSRLLLYKASPLYSPVNDLTKWQAAADAAKAVMDAGNYSLEPTLEGLRNLFYNGNNASHEIIFRQQTHPNSGPGGIFAIVEYNFLRASGTVGSGGFSYFTPTQQMVDAYDMANGKTISDIGSGYNPQNPYLNRDPRFYKFIYHHGAPLKARVLDYSVDGQDREIGSDYGNPTGYNIRKFANEDYFSPGGNSIFSLGSQLDRIPWIHIRYAEILLNYAEAINEAQGPLLAYDAINQIRQRAGMPDLTPGLSQSEMRMKIMNERRIELAFEEHRYYDVRRWKIAMSTENITVKGVKITKPGGIDFYQYVTADGPDIVTDRKFLPYEYFWPLTRDELRASPGLVQTDGY